MKQDREELPLPDYDHLTLPELGDRVRALTDDELRALIEYEETHAARVPALEVLRARRKQLAEGATPTGGDAAGERPGGARAAGGSPVTPETQGEPGNPPPHGVPHQPRRPKGDYQPGHG